LAVDYLPRFSEIARSRGRTSKKNSRIALPVLKEDRIMNIDHVGVWARDMEALRAFYEKYFGA
jgi:hypothetical protein